MVRRFVKALGGVAIKDRPPNAAPSTESPSQRRVDVPAGEHEFELSCARLAKHRNGTAAETIRAAVVLDLLHDFFGVFGAVKANEYFVNHRLLVGREKLGELVVSDVPVVVHLRAQRVVERKTNRFLLFFIEALEKRGHERF